MVSTLMGLSLTLYTGLRVRLTTVGVQRSDVEALAIELVG